VGNAGMPSLRSTENLNFLELSPLVEQIDCVVVQTGVNDLTSCLAGPRPAPPRWIDSRVWRLTQLVVRSRIDSGTLVEDTAGDVYRRRRAVRHAAQISDEQPAIDACLADFEENLRGIITACRNRDVRVVFTTQPVLWRADLDAENDALLWFGQLPDARYLSARQLRAAMDRYNDVVRKVCEAEGVGLIDLDQLSGDPAVFYDDCHFTDTGARRVARLVGDWLIANPDAKTNGTKS
jgi:lysophospholipase L1-like esterase